MPTTHYISNIANLYHLLLTSDTDAVYHVYTYTLPSSNVPITLLQDYTMTLHA